MLTQRIVLTGGPGTGKTSIIETLKKEGNICFEEVSREIIKREMAKGTDVLPWDNLPAFSEEVMKGRVEQFEKAKSNLQFYDRSIIDTIAYLHVDNLPVNEDWHLKGLQLQYAKKVFITPPWKDIFETDNERKESYAQLEKLHEILVKTYTEYGYTLIEVPKGSIEERTQFILKEIK